jgi:hypothetical protein
MFLTVTQTLQLATHPKAESSAMGSASTARRMTSRRRVIGNYFDIHADVCRQDARGVDSGDQVTSLHTYHTEVETTSKSHSLESPAAPRPFCSNQS